MCTLTQYFITLKYSIAIYNYVTKFIIENYTVRYKVTIRFVFRTSVPLSPGESSGH